MRLRTLLGRLGLPLSIVALATAGAALPAAADPPGYPPYVGFGLPSRLGLEAGRTRVVDMKIQNSQDEVLKGTRITFGQGPWGETMDSVSAALGLTLPDSCAGLSCPLPDLVRGETTILRLTFRPTAALDGAGQRLTYALRGDHDGEAWSSYRDIAVYGFGTGVDLELAPINDYTLDPGASTALPITFTNTGSKAPAGFYLRLSGGAYLDFPVRYSNCFVPQYHAGVACVFDQPVQPGETLTLDGITVHAPQDTPGPFDYYAVASLEPLNTEELGAALGAARAKRQATASAALTPIPAPNHSTPSADELNDWNNEQSFYVSVTDNKVTDLAAVGGTFEGKIGDRITVEAGLRNNGPAAKNGSFSVTITLPTGIDVNRADPRCIRESGKYYCQHIGNLRAGEQSLFSIAGTIRRAGGTAGSVRTQDFDSDPVPANNVAVLRVKLTTASPTTSPSASPTASPTASPSASPTASSPTASPTASPTSAGPQPEETDEPVDGGGGGLPVTGSPVALIAGVGLLLIVAGAAALILTKRHRVVTSDK